MADRVQFSTIICNPDRSRVAMGALEPAGFIYAECQEKSGALHFYTVACVFAVDPAGLSQSVYVPFCQINAFY